MVHTYIVDMIRMHVKWNESERLTRRFVSKNQERKMNRLRLAAAILKNSQKPAQYTNFICYFVHKRLANQL